GDEGGLFPLGLPGVVLLLLLEVLGELGDVLPLLRRLGELGGRRENAGDLERDKIGIGGEAVGLDFYEQRVVGDGVVDGGGGEERVEAAGGRDGVVGGEDFFDDLPLAHVLGDPGGVL